MGKEKRREVLTGFSNKYELGDTANLEELQVELNSPPEPKNSLPKERSLFKWIILTIICIILVISFTILANI